MPWTDSQNEAIEALENDICVSAGAGSGKTGVLVERFLRIVRDSAEGRLRPEERAAVGDILVITFTDKATREMKERMVAALTEAGLHDQRRQLETAYISTIHGFCSRLLKENPFEAGIDPAFQVLDENDARRMLRASFELTLERAEAEGETDLTELAASAQHERIYGTDARDPMWALLTSVEIGLSRIRGTGIRPDELASVAAQGIDAASRRARAPLVARVNAVFCELQEAAAVLDSAGGAMGALEARRRAVLECLRDHTSLSPDADWASIVAAVANAAEAGARAGGAYHTRAGGLPVEAEIAQALGRIREAAGTLSDLAGLDAPGEEAAAAMGHRFLRLLAFVWTAYEEAKREAGVLDNDDLQARAVQLLDTSPGARSRYANAFRHILVDEFQDTNPLQMKLIRMLHRPIRAIAHDPARSLEDGATARPPERSDTGPANSLFVVGDVQQSIYGFRDADPTIFQNVERRFQKGAQGRRVVLDRNFRSRSEILSFVNSLFEQVWRHGPTSFTRLVPGGEYGPKEAPSVEVLAARDAGRPGYVELEASAVAGRIYRMVRNQELRFTDTRHAQFGRPIGYRGIALLLRGLTDVVKYEEAFSRAGVPCFIVGGGRGYYARREIRDVMNMLTVLDSPLDDLALVATLRSPMVGCDIDTIYALCRFARQAAGGGRSPLYPFLARFLESDAATGDSADRARRFYAIAESLRTDEDRLPVGHLLERLLSATEYDLRILVRPDGRRRLANVRKLIQMANAAPLSGVSEFIRRLRDLERISEREGDAPTEAEAADVVKIITIHKAKGLEFPVVFLGDMAREIYVGQPGPFLCDPLSTTVGCHLHGYRSAAHRLIAKTREQAEVEESSRLLYVALTRAREHLVLCGYPPNRRSARSWANLVFPRLGILAPPSRPETRSFGGTNIQVTASTMT